MRGHRNFSVAALACVILANFLRLLSGDESSDDLHTDRIRKLDAESEKLTASIQQVCARFSLRYPGPSRFQATWAKDEPPRNSSIASFIEVGTTTLSFDKIGWNFRDGDDQPVSFFNYYVDDAPELKVLYNSPQPPKWSIEYATEVGEAFRGLFPLPKGTYLSPPQVEFRQDSQEMEKHYLGRWWFTWWRADSHGNTFMGDHICFCMSEGFCPSLIGTYLSTPFHELSAAPMTLAAALKFAGVHGAKLKRSNLAVILPMEGPFAGKEARLAWNIWFDPPPPPADPWYARIYNGVRGWSWVTGIFGPAPVPSLLRAYPFSVWIDAYTGEVLGGDAEM